MDHKLEIVLAARDITGQAFTKLQGRMTALTKSVFSLKGGLVVLAGAAGMKMAATAALDVAASFEQMEVKLDALTKGKGQETLDRLNAWALEMPVNTRKAVDTFAMMQAMGLDPTIDKMQTLVDVSSIFGEDTMPRVARALGQMATLGKLSAEELNQMSEAGINARKYLTEAFGMTVEELKKSQVSIEEIIDAIWQGLDADFGGAAKKAQDSWQGMVATFKSYMDEILKQIMDAGVFDALKDQLDTVNAGLKTWIANNEELIKQKVPEYLNAIGTGLRFIGETFSIIVQTGRNLDEVLGISAAYRSIQDFKKAFAEIGAVLSGEKDWNTGLPTGAADRVTEEFDNLHQAYTTVISDTDQLGTQTRAATAAFDEYDRMIQKFNQELDGMALAATEYAAPAVDELDRMIAEFTDELNGAALAATDYSDQIADAMKDSAEEAAAAFENLKDSLESGLVDTLADIVTGAKTAKEAFRDFARSTLKWMIKLIMQQAVSSLFSNFSFSTNAQGNVYDQSGLVPFARGGVVHRPAIFPFASGIGLMGEAGPEAILPLTRTSGGDLGVKTEGGTGGVTNNFNIMAIDSRSFEEVVRRNPSAVVNVVGDAMIGNTPLRDIMRRTL